MMLSSSIRAPRLLQLRDLSPSNNTDRAPSSAPASNVQVSPPKESKRAIFDEIAHADLDFENAKKVADSMLLARSSVIEKLLLSYGKGPYMYQGERVRIVKRRSENGKRLVYFFRALSKTEPEDIE